MATGNSGSAIFDGEYCRLKINWSETYDVSANTSVVSITSVWLAVTSWTGTYPGDMLIKVNGQAAAAVTLNGNNASNAVAAFSQGLSSYNEVKVGGSSVTGSSQAIAHNSDGSKTSTISIHTNNWSYPGFRNADWGYQFTNGASRDITLTNIPRASSFTTSGSTIGGNMTIGISRASSSFTHTLRYRYNSTGSYTNIATGVGTSYTWAMPASLGGSIPTAMSGTWQLSCLTYNGSTQIGETTKTITLTLPANCGPTGTSGWCAAGYTNTGSGLPGGITNAVAGYSKLTAIFDNEKHQANYGASIVSRKAYVGATEVVSGTTKITTASTSVRFVVTDSRGKTLEDTKTVSAYAYSQPTLSGADAKRCDSGGTASDSGTYWYAIATANISTIGGQNSGTLTAQIKQAGGSYDAAVPLTSGTKSTNGGSLSLTTSYTVKITITDTVGTTTAVEFAIPTQSVTLNFRDGGRGAAFGGYAQTTAAGEDLLDVWWDLKVHGDTTLEDLDAASGDFGALSVNSVPVLTTLPYASGQTTINSTPTSLSDVYTLALPAGLKLLTVMASYYSAIPQELALGSDTYIRAGQTAALSGKTAQYLQLTTLTEETSLHVYGKWAQSGSSVLSWKYITMPI